MSSSQLNIFLLGATGYVGGSVLAALKTDPAFGSASITALIRSVKNQPLVEKLGVKVIIGNHSDLETITAESEKADLVLNGADSDDPALIKAIIAGLEKRGKANPTGRKPIFVHTSGTAVVMDNAKGDANPDRKSVDDNDVEAIRNIPDAALHRNVDNEIFAADERGIISAYIICPGTIWGRGTGPVNRVSLQVPALVGVGIARKQIVYPGSGTNVWVGLHILDLVSLYLLVIKLALSGNDKSSSYEKFYFATVGDPFLWSDVAKKLARLLHAKGLVDSPEAVGVPIETDPRLAWVATNCKATSSRGRGIGWNPKEASFLDTLEEDLEALIEKGL